MVHLPLSESFKEESGGFRTFGVHTHNLIGGSENLPEASQLEVFAGTSNHLGYTMHPRGTSSWEHNAPKSNKLLELQSHLSPWGAQIDATNAMARTQEVLKSFTLKSHQKQQMLMGEKRGITKRRTTKELQELDPLGSPHLEEKLIGER